jgi:hypothetical protein
MEPILLYLFWKIPPFVAVPIYTVRQENNDTECVVRQLATL